MDWTIVVHTEDKYVEITTRGFADRDGSLNMAKALTHTMRTQRINRALIDHRQVEDVIGSTIDVYDRPRAFPLIGAILRIRIAEIIRPEHAAHFKFLETVCVNQGYRFRVFHDKDAALAWLLQ